MPILSDKLLFDGKIYRSNNPDVGILKGQIRHTGQDRNFDPITSSVLPLSNFFRGELSKKSLPEVFDFDKLRPQKVCTVGSKFYTRNELHDKNGGKSSTFVLMEFTDGVPTSYEVWMIAGQFRRLLYRTQTKWKKHHEQYFPVEIEAIQVLGKKTSVFKGEISWKFNDDVPRRLFTIKDVRSEVAFDW